MNSIQPSSLRRVNPPCGGIEFRPPSSFRPTKNCEPRSPTLLKLDIFVVIFVDFRRGFRFIPYVFADSSLRYCPLSFSRILIRPRPPPVRVSKKQIRAFKVASSGQPGLRDPYVEDIMPYEDFAGQARLRKTAARAVAAGYVENSRFHFRFHDQV